MGRQDYVLNSGRDNTTQLRQWFALSDTASGGTCRLLGNGFSFGTTVANEGPYTYEVSADDADCGMMIGSRTGAGMVPSVNSFWDGNISEVIVYNGKLSDAQQATVVNYLLNKYNLNIL